MDSFERAKRKAMEQPLPDTFVVEGQWFELVPAQPRDETESLSDWLPSFEALEAGGYSDWEEGVMQTRELEGQALDWAVAMVALAGRTDRRERAELRVMAGFSPSIDWTQGATEAFATQLPGVLLAS